MHGVRDATATKRYRDGAVAPGKWAERFARVKRRYAWVVGRHWRYALWSHRAAVGREMAPSVHVSLLQRQCRKTIYSQSTPFTDAIGISQ